MARVRRSVQSTDVNWEPICIHDLRRAELVDHFVQSLEAKLGLQRVGDAPGQHLAGEPVHGGHQIEEALSHRQIGNVGAPDLIGPVDPQSAEQIGVGLVALGKLFGVRLLVDRYGGGSENSVGHCLPDERA